MSWYASHGAVFRGTGPCSHLNKSDAAGYTQIYISLSALVPPAMHLADLVGRLLWQHHGGREFLGSRA